MGRSLVRWSRTNCAATATGFEYARTHQLLALKLIRTHLATTLFPGRLIAFLDVLGFSQRLANARLEEIHTEYAALIDEARTKVFDSKDTAGKPQNNFAWARFVFDSLIVVSNDVSGADGASKRSPDARFS